MYEGVVVLSLDHEPMSVAARRRHFGRDGRDDLPASQPRMGIFGHLNLRIQQSFQCHAVFIEHPKGVAIESQGDLDFLLLAADHEIQCCSEEHFRKQVGPLWGLIARSRCGRRRFRSCPRSVVVKTS